MCRFNFENPLPKHTSRDYPPSTQKLEAFETVCKFLEDKMELLTLAEFLNNNGEATYQCLLCRNDKDQIKRKISRPNSVCF